MRQQTKRARPVRDLTDVTELALYEECDIDARRIVAELMYNTGQHQPATGFRLLHRELPEWWIDRDFMLRGLAGPVEEGGLEIEPGISDSCYWVRLTFAVTDVYYALWDDVAAYLTKLYQMVPNDVQLPQLASYS